VASVSLRELSIPTIFPRRVTACNSPASLRSVLLQNVTKIGLDDIVGLQPLDVIVLVVSSPNSGDMLIDEISD
jgi:hypothetical protein